MNVRLSRYHTSAVDLLAKCLNKTPDAVLTELLDDALHVHDLTVEDVGRPIPATLVESIRSAALDRSVRVVHPADVYEAAGVTYTSEHRRETGRILREAGRVLKRRSATRANPHTTAWVWA